MKRTLLASAVCLGFGIGSAAPAWAVLPVTDTASITQRAVQAANQLAQLVQEYRVLQSSYAQLQSTVAALQHGNQVLGTAPGLLSSQMQSPGSSSGAMPGLTFGTGLSSGAQPFYSQNHVYTPQGSDFAAAEMQRREQATANMQAEVQAGYDRSADRMASLSALQQSIEDQPDVTGVAAAEAHINAEHLYLTNEGNNVARLQLLQATQARVDQQRAEQNDRKDAEDWHTDAAARAWGTGS